MRTRHPILIVSIVCLSLRHLIGAPVPLSTAFTYQGQLKHNGSPVSGPVTFRFSLWDAAGAGAPPVGGNPVGGTELIADIPVSNGVFTATLNAGGEFGSTAFNGEARWLQIEVCADPACASVTVLSPRQPVTAAPYALGVQLPLSETAALGSNAIQITNTGAGRTANFIIDNTTSNNATVRTENNGVAAGRALYALNTGLGDGGVFEVNNPASDANAVESSTNGTGHAVQGTNSGTGRAGSFFISNAANPASAVVGITNGTGNGVFGQCNTSAGYGGSFTNTGGGEALHAGGDADVTGSLGIGTPNPAVKLHVRGGTDASPAGGGFIVAGDTAGSNLAIDTNEIMARNNGAAANLFINNGGGDVTITPSAITHTGQLEATGASATSPALTIAKGSVQVSGMGVNTNTFVFIHKATNANIHTDDHRFTTIDNPLTNNNPNAVLFVTSNLTNGVLVDSIVKVTYYNGRWLIFTPHDDITEPSFFNVLVFTP